MRIKYDIQKHYLKKANLLTVLFMQVNEECVNTCRKG